MFAVIRHCLHLHIIHRSQPLLPDAVSPGTDILHRCHRAIIIMYRINTQKLALTLMPLTTQHYWSGHYVFHVYSTSFH